MIDKSLRRIELVCFDNALQIDQRSRTCARNRAPSQQQVYVVQARHPGATIEPKCAHFVPMPACECGSSLVDIPLCVMTKTQSKQLHEFTRIIFVGSIFPTFC